MPYLQYYITAKDKYDIHSPFLFEFLTQVLEDKQHYQAYTDINEVEGALNKNERFIEVVDLGAGSTLNNSNKRSVKNIFQNTAFKVKYGKLLYRIVQFYKPANIIELGTGLGIATSFMAKGNINSSIITIEGDKNIAKEAVNVFSLLNINNVELINNSFDAVLTDVLNKQSTLDLALIDGNHQYSSTLKYYNAIANKVNNNSIVIFDDIRWSQEMYNAWQEIIKDKRISLSLDLYKMGIVFFRKEIHVKQHYAIRF